MKKLLTVLLCLMIVCCICFGCSKSKNEVDWESRINYYQTAYYCGAATGLSINLSCGMKEKDYVLDGEIGPMTEFCTLTLVPLVADYVKPSYGFVLTGDKGKVEGTMIKEIFGSSYYADIDKSADIGTPSSVKIISGETLSLDIALEDKMAGKADYKAALSAAVSEYADKLSEDTPENCKREITLKFAGDRRNTQNPYYWYVSIAASVDDFLALLIDPETGKVVTKKG